MAPNPVEARTSVAVAASRHWQGTTGARDVHTHFFDEGLVAAYEAIKERGLLALHGSPGTGKTFVAKAASGKLALPFHYLECAPGVRGRRQQVAMLNAMEWPTDPRQLVAELMGDLARACASEPRVVALDEIDRWGSEGVELIRYLWSQPENQTTFIFIGFRVARLIAANPALDSRLEHRVEFAALNPDETIGALRDYHAVFQVADERLLRTVHALTHGEWRRIAQLLRRILIELGDEAPKLTRDLLEDAWCATGRGR